MSPPTPRRLYLITAPRTASNLLTKILALDKQSDVLYRAPGGYFFLGANEILDAELNIRFSPVSTWDPAVLQRVKDAKHSCSKDLISYLEDAEHQGKIAFVKEHVDWMLDPTVRLPSSLEDQDESWNVQPYKGETLRGKGNHTMLPDALLETFHPTFLIRHPALVFPSSYRALRDVGSLDAVDILEPGQRRKNQYRFSFYWIRSLYEFYSNQLRDGKDNLSGDTWPLVLEADDVMTKPEVLAKWCKLAGLDESKLRYEWDPATVEEKAEFPSKFRDRVLRYMSCISTSSSTQTDKVAGDVDIAKEALKWKEEFGEDAGEQMEGFVRDAMDDYEHLKARRLRV